MRRLLLLFVLVCGVSVLHAQDSCPAITHQEVDAFFGSPTQLQVNWRSGNNYECRFAAGTLALVVTVRPYKFQNGWDSYVAQCIAKGTAVTGIGDEAVSCTKDATSQTLGHVRDTLLDVRLTGAPPQPDTLHRIAQTVAGNLR